MGKKDASGNGSQAESGCSEIEVGRSLLGDWEAAQADNYFSYDVSLQRALEYYWGFDDYRRHAVRLNQFGGVLATIVDTAAREANLDGNLPRLERFDEFGRRTEQIIFHPSHHVAGRHIYASEMMSVYGQPGNNLLSLAMFYLSSQNGEAGHNCPLACTAGLIKVLQAVGDRQLKERYIPGLLNPDYDNNLTGAQFLTEVQGGSDVGANATVATPLNAAEGSWLLNGEKWFCSNVDADLALVTARVPGQGEGTRGLGLFILPRTLDEGLLNNVTIRRLKDKLGTRSMATAELEFRNALAYQVGDTRKGFKNVMTYVINTSRIYNAVGVSGNARRAYLTARSYAQHRMAFGKPIIHFPLVQAILADMRADATAMISGTLYIASLLDDIELGRAAAETEGFLRLAINLNKYRSAVLAHDVINRGIELLGGNGAVETFSVLPRLLRDNVVYENWEGSHNVLLAQAQRDIRRYGVDEPFFNVLEAMWSALPVIELRDQGLAELEKNRLEMKEVLAMDELTAAIYFRPLIDRLTDLYYAVRLATEGGWEMEHKNDRSKTRLASLFFQRRAAGREPKDIAYYDDTVARLCQ